MSVARKAKTKNKPRMGLQKPPPVVPAAEAEAFVAHRSKPKSERSEQLSAGRSTVTRSRDGRVLERKTIYLEPTLAKRLALASVEHGRDMSEIVAESLSAWFDSHRTAVS